MASIRLQAFLPPVILLVATLIWSLSDFDGFFSTADQANRWLLQNFDWAYSLFSFSAVLLVVYIFFSPLGRVRIGGVDAVPILSRWNWFAITLCTTIAIGILFWATAEPILHVQSPPAFTNAAANSPAAFEFAMSTLFLHWTITPYALYTVCALAFSLSYHNFDGPYSLSGPVSVISGGRVPNWISSAIDAVGLFALTAGVAAVLGVGVLTIAGGIGNLFGIADTVLLRGAIAALIVATFILSSVSGIQRGIKILSDINIRIFVLFALFVLVFGPTLDILELSLKGVVHYARTFVSSSLALGARGGDPWTLDWSVFYFANWLAWAPITALFLGRISIGYTVREFLTFNLILPALFGAVWMGIFGASAISLNAASGGSFAEKIAADGPESAIYALLDALPFAAVTVAIFVFVAFLSFVTAMDSNTQSIADVCLKKDSSEEERGRAARRIKIFWGLLIGGIAFTMTATTGIDGVRMLSNLGGILGLVILIAFGASLLVMRFRRLPALIGAVPETEK